MVVPVGLKSKGAMKSGKVIWLSPIAEFPDADAIKLCQLDPNNFELVEAGDVPSNAHELQSHGGMAEGLELDADPPKPKRGRRSKAQMAAFARAKENHA